MRFIGGTATHQRVETEFGRRLLAWAGVPKIAPVELPSETFAYLASPGDYHPPLSGLFLLTLALLRMAVIDSEQETRFAQAVMGATIPVCMIANGWSFPLQALLVSTWVAFRLRERRPHSDGYRTQCLQRDLRGCIRRPRAARSACVSAVHVG